VGYTINCYVIRTLLVWIHKFKVHATKITLGLNITLDI